MQALSMAWLAAAAVSFFCERLAMTPAGLSGSLVLAAGSVLLPDLLNHLIVPVFFHPDVTIVIDPSDPDPQIVTRGMRQAMRTCLTEGRSICLLISRVPGCVLTIGLNAVRQRVFVTVASEIAESEEKKSQSALPLFSPGQTATWYRLTGGGDNVRLCFRPAERAKDGVICETPTLGWRTVGIAGLVLAGVVWFWAGIWVVGVAVLPFVVIRTSMCRYGTLAPRLLLRPVRVVLGSLGVIVFNLIRMAMF